MKDRSSVSSSRWEASAAELIEFRRDLHAHLGPWADAAFELCDALASAPAPVTSLPHLSLSACFRRSHGSLYRALDQAEPDVKAIRDLLAAHLPHHWPPIFAIDASTWPRCSAETSPGRGYYYSASRHSSGKPIVAGWCYQWITQLSRAPDSWTAPADAVRLIPGEDQVAASAAQIKDLASRLAATRGDRAIPVIVADAGYDPIALTSELAETAVTIAVRIRADRVFYAPAPNPAGTPGRPPRHGPRRACSEPGSWPAPDHQTHTTDERYGSVHVAAWHDLHPRLACRGRWANHEQPPIITGTVIRLDVEHLPKSLARGTKKTLWLWTATGAGQASNIETCWRAYLHRFDIEHTFRFVKQTLGWTTPRPQTPKQADTWTWLIIAAYTQLRLARPLAEDHHLPWEKPAKPGQLTPNRVRREFPNITPTLGTPARAPKPSKAGPGRPKGTKTGPRTRHPAIKTTKKPTNKV